MEILLLILFYVVLFAVYIAILRWAFRINDIVTRLEHVSMSNHRIVEILEDVKAAINRNNSLSQQIGNETESSEEK